jgi:type IV pilus assembly protein PilY1
VRSAHRPARACLAAARTLTLLALAAPARTPADDTEMFFVDGLAPGASSTNILLVLPASRAMGCPIGTAARCETAVSDGSSRMDVLKSALARLLEAHAGDAVSIGLMRSNNDGREGGAARGGFVAQDVAPLTPERVAELERWICPPGLDPARCHRVVPEDGEPAGQLMLAPSNDAGFCAVDGSGTPDCRDRLGRGGQPLTELLFEANRYFAGRRPAWGAQSVIGPGHAFPGSGHDPRSIWGPATMHPPDCVGDASLCRYRSPVGDCQRNVVVILSDGLLAPDRGHDEGRGSIAKSAGDPPPYDRWFRPYHDPAGLTAGPGTEGCSTNRGIEYPVVDPATGLESTDAISHCPDDLAYSMRSGGFVEGRKSAQVFTYAVGLDVAAATRAEGVPPAAPLELLRLVARAGGGSLHRVDCVGCTPAQAADDLAGILGRIVREAVAANASFAAPAVPVNSFNRAENVDHLYLSVFRPATTQRWRGNVKKYRLGTNGDILGRDDALAVNPLTGRFLPGVSSLWPSVPAAADGDDVLEGGAAHGLPEPGRRRVYTNEDGAGTHDLRSYDIDQLIPRADAAEVLGYAAAGREPPECPAHSDDAPADRDNPAVCRLIAWIRGADVADEIPPATDGKPAGNGNYDEPRHDLGDPLHTRPLVVTYGGDAAHPRSIVYAVTNDGALHAFDPDSGRERWAFIPWDRLGRMLALYRDAAARPRTSLGLDGTLRVLKLDRNSNGIIEPAADGSGDRVVLFFGMRRGGRNYYAVDVTEVSPVAPAGDSPRLLWIAGPDGDGRIPPDRQLPRIGQTWSRPVVGRIKVPGHRSPDDLVVLVAGGYDPGTQDPPDGKPQPYVNDAMGTGLYLLDAFTGERLWRAGPDAGADLRLAGMTAAMPADPAALDLSGDGYLDVAYVGDLKGRVWRLDFDLAAANVRDLARGGILAELGGPGVAGARRFFAAPDVSSVIHGGRRWLNVAIGSGNRELPLSDRETHDRLYSIRDYGGASRRDWSVGVPIRETDLVDVTPDAAAATLQAPVPAGAAGWMLRLETRPGEKAVSPSRTFDHTIFFPTFLPAEVGGDGGGDACKGTRGYNHLYQVSVVDGTPARHLREAAHPLAAGGLAIRLEQPGIAPEPVFLFPPARADAGADAARPAPLCLVGVESCGSIAAVEPRRTYWRQRGAE